MTKQSTINEKFRKIIFENPTLEFKFFVSEDANQGDWGYEECDISEPYISELALYNEEQWLDVEDYEEKVYEELADKYKDESELNKEVDKFIKNVEFERFICVNIG